MGYPDVIIPDNAGEYPFVIVRANSRYMLRTGSSKHELHRTVVSQVLCDAGITDHEKSYWKYQRGGGSVEVIKPETGEKVLRFYGKSHDFGCPPRHLIQSVLEGYADSNSYIIEIKTEEINVRSYVLDEIAEDIRESPNKWE